MYSGGWGGGIVSSAQWDPVSKYQKQWKGKKRSEGRKERSGREEEGGRRKGKETQASGLQI